MWYTSINNAMDDTDWLIRGEAPEVSSEEGALMGARRRGDNVM